MAIGGGDEEGEGSFERDGVGHELPSPALL